MQATDKFRSDLDATLRRAGAAPEPLKLEALRGFFFQSFRQLPKDLLAGLFTSFLEKWRDSPEKALAWLSGVASLLMMDYDGTPFAKAEWEELRDAFNLDAGELDLELLSYVMTAVVDHGAI